MDIRELGRLDLNLLVALEALLEERSVSLAAERLYISQSAMSKTLGRLRDVFDDPLFIRQSSSMVPTPRAQQLAVQLPEVLRQVQSMMQPLEFDPLTYQGEFNLMVQGHLGMWLLPILLERLHRTGPHIRLRTLAICEDPIEQLGKGTLDFVLHAEYQSYPPKHKLMTLGFAQPVLLVRKGHPLEGTVPSWADLEKYPHVRLIIPEFENIQFQGDVDGWEDSEFFRREFELVPHLFTDHLFTALRVVMASDYIFPAPPLFMEQDEFAREVISIPLPSGEEIAVKYVMVHHERIEHSPAHEFLRSEILDVVEEFRHRYGLPCLEDMRMQRHLAY